jgi:hypothetical protein
MKTPTVIRDLGHTRGAGDPRPRLTQPRFPVHTQSPRKRTSTNGPGPLRHDLDLTFGGFRPS